MQKAKCEVGLGKFDFTPHSVRHSGPSADFLSKTRNAAEIQARGRWRAAKSIQRYLKPGQMMAKMNKIPAAIWEKAKAALPLVLRKISRYYGASARWQQLLFGAWAQSRDDYCCIWFLIVFLDGWFIWLSLSLKLATATTTSSLGREDKCCCICFFTFGWRDLTESHRLGSYRLQQLHHLLKVVSTLAVNMWTSQRSRILLEAQKSASGWASLRLRCVVPIGSMRCLHHWVHWPHMIHSQAFSLRPAPCTTGHKVEMITAAFDFWLFFWMADSFDSHYLWS